jgi:hypothetical protein
VEEYSLPSSSVFCSSLHFSNLLFLIQSGPKVGSLLVVRFPPRRVPNEAGAPPPRQVPPSSSNNTPRSNTERPSSARCLSSATLPGKLVFCRLVGNRKGDKVQIITSSDERLKTYVQVRSAVPIPEEVRFSLGNANAMQRITNDPFLDVWDNFESEVNKCVFALLSKQQVTDPEELLNRISILLTKFTASNGKRVPTDVTLKELKPFRQQLEAALKICETDPVVLDSSKEMESYISDFLTNVLERTGVIERIFAPTKVSALTTTQELALTRSVKQRVEVEQGKCEEAMSRLLIARAEDMTGSKQEITEWWLELIEQGNVEKTRQSLLLFFFLSLSLDKSTDNLLSFPSSFLSLFLSFFLFSKRSTTTCWTKATTSLL